MEMSAALLTGFKKQVAMECGNALLYMQAYSWFKAMGWAGFAKMALEQSCDESKHASEYVEYAARRGQAIGQIDPAKPTKPIPADVRGIVAMFAALEDQTETSIRALVDVAVAAKDHGAVDWTGSFLAMQEKESQEYRDLMARVSQCDDGTLVLVDRELNS